jgi:hypothetical protein
MRSKMTLPTLTSNCKTIYPVLFIFLNTYSYRIILQIFFTSFTTSKNVHFDVHFNNIISKVWPCATPRTFPPFRSGFNAISDRPRVEGVRWAVTQNPARLQPGFWSVSGPGPWRVRGLEGSQAGGSLALSKWTDGVTPFWGNSQNHSALLHTLQYRQR